MFSGKYSSNNIDMTMPSPESRNKKVRRSQTIGLSQKIKEQNFDWA
jgi:hypothetical protein